MATTTVDELNVLIKAQADQFKSEISKVQNQIKGFGNDVDKQTRGINKSFGSIGVAGVALGNVIASVLGAAFRTLSSQVSGAIERFDTLNNFGKVMSNLKIGVDDANASIAYLSDKLIGLPTSLSDAAAGVQRITAATKNVKYSTEAFLALNNAIVAGGAAPQVQAQALEQFNQSLAKGKVDRMEWLAMINAMPAQLSQVAEAFGYANADAFGTALKTSAVSMADFTNMLIKMNNTPMNGFKTLDEQARNATGGIQTSIVNIKNAFQRGMAQIMDAIGAANIAGFFQGVINVINTVSNYVVAFVRIIKEAIAWVQALFGGGSGSTAGLVKETGAASSNMGGIASGASDAASGLDDATGAAKKLNKQLASFDEMNVLKEPESNSGGSGSGSGGSGGGGYDISDFNWDNALGGGEDKVGAIVDKMKKFFADLFDGIDIDVKALAKSFKRFWDDIKKGAKPVLDVFGDIWDDYIKPLINWTGNSLLPAVLNAIGGAIQFVGKVIGQVWDLFLKPFIDAFLVPIAKFTGGIIVSVLNAIGDALRKLAESETAVRAVAAAIVALGTVVVSAFAAKAIIDWIAKVQAATAAAKLLGSEGNIAIGGLTGLIANMSAKITEAGGGFTGLVSVMKSGLSGLGAMLFNPITLAIAGTVAGLVSLKYMWDTITYTTKDYKTATEQTEYWQDKLTGAVSATEVAVKSYDDYVNASKNTELQQIYAKKDLADKQNAYAQALRDSTKSADELRAMELEVELAEAKVKDATKAHEDAVKSIDEAIKNEQTSLAHQIQVSEQSRIQKLLEKGSYDEVMTQIGKLAQTEYSYTDSHGNVMKTTEKQTATWAALTLTKLAEQDKGFDSYLSNMGLNSDNFTENLSEMSDNFSKYGINIKSEWDGVNKSVKTLVDNTVQDVKKQSSESMFKDAGKNVPFGVKKGIEEGSGNAFSAISAFGSSLLSKLKASLKEKSPSKATAEMGEFLMQGLSNGIDNNASTAISSAVSAAKETMAAFSAPLQDFSVPDLSADISRSVRNDVFSHVEVDSVFDGLSKPVVLELDGQVLGKFNIDFINDQSFIRNATVINI